MQEETAMGLWLLASPGLPFLYSSVMRVSVQDAGSTPVVHIAQMC